MNWQVILLDKSKLQKETNINKDIRNLFDFLIKKKK